MYQNSSNIKVLFSLTGWTRSERARAIDRPCEAASDCHAEALTARPGPRATDELRRCRRRESVHWNSSGKIYNII